MKKTFYHKVGSIGGSGTSSLYVTLPKELATQLGIKKGSSVTISAAAKRMVIEPTKPTTKK